MVRNWTSKLCVPLASAALLAACTQQVSDDQTQNRTPIDNATNQNRQDRKISLIGCLGTGPGTHQYVLTHVRPAPLGEQPSDLQSNANLTLPDNSAVRLTVDGDDRQLTRLMGQTVEVTGLLRDDGHNTIGTSGRLPASPDQPESRTDHSQAAAAGQSYSAKVRQEAGPIGTRSMNNSTYPEVTVQQVNGTGKKCGTR
jgi:type 1 fimbria pilin